MPISAWSTTPASNISAAPNGAPEGWAPSAVNDTIRQQMADHKTQWLDAEWFNNGDSGVSRASATTFKVTGDVTAKYSVNRRVKCYDSTTIYATIVATSYSAPDTTVTIETDSGSLSASMSSVALAILAPTNLSVPSTTGRKSANVASASTVDLSAVPGTSCDITGTTTITAFGTVAAGVTKTLRFTGALTLTHNATSLIIPGAVNITTSNGDIAVVRSLGSGNWVVDSYVYASGSNLINGLKGADLASASTVDLSTATGDFVDITGTTTITAFGTAKAGIMRLVRFTGALTLTHNATSLILPGASNITTVNGDVAMFRSLGSGNWVCCTYTLASGAVGAPFSDANALVKGGTDSTKLLRFEVDGFTTGTTRVVTFPDMNLGFWALQQVRVIDGAMATTTGTIPIDDTIPQNTEGGQFLSLAITPKSATSVLQIDVNLAHGETSSGNPGVALFQDSTANALAGIVLNGHDGMEFANFTYYMTSGTTSSTTFKVRAGRDTAGTLTFNGYSGARRYGGVMPSSIFITEWSS